MAEPAREDAPAPAPASRRAIGRIDPVSPGWENVQLAMIHGERAMNADTRLLVLIAREAAARPGDPALLEMLGAAIGIAREHGEIGREHGEIARRCVIDETVLEAREQAAYSRGVADCKAARCNLGVVRGGG